MGKFLGTPYPITKDARGYFYSQSGASQIKSDLLILLLTNPGERCLTGDTEISLANGEEVPIRYLVNQGELRVYSYDNSVVLGKAIAHKTLENADLMEISFNDSKVRCTPNHLWLLRNGRYCRADKLCIDDSLMPVYKQTDCRIKEIRTLEEKEDCYDLTVETYHNFALTAGVFVHNCMLPEFGTPLRDLMFEPSDASLYSRAREMIINSIRTWEPRITVQQIDVSSGIDGDSLNPDDDRTEVGGILSIRILFLDPDNIQEVQELKLGVPLGVEV